MYLLIDFVFDFLVVHDFVHPLIFFSFFIDACLSKRKAAAFLRGKWSEQMG
jgi:hypothetical protein